METIILMHGYYEDRFDGGPGSGNWGHEGVPGQVGGSKKGSGGGKDAETRQFITKGLQGSQKDYNEAIGEAISYASKSPENFVEMLDLAEKLGPQFLEDMEFELGPGNGSVPKEIRQKAYQLLYERTIGEENTSVSTKESATENEERYPDNEAGYDRTEKYISAHAQQAKNVLDEETDWARAAMEDYDLDAMELLGDRCEKGMVIDVGNYWAECDGRKTFSVYSESGFEANELSSYEMARTLIDSYDGEHDFDYEEIVVMSPKKR